MENLVIGAAVSACILFVGFILANATNKSAKTKSRTGYGFSILTLVTLMLMASCERPAAKSGHLTDTEKVVIISNPEMDVPTGAYQYKVKRINMGVVTYVKLGNVYAQNDTILVLTSKLR